MRPTVSGWARQWTVLSMSALQVAVSPAICPQVALHPVLGGTNLQSPVLAPAPQPRSVALYCIGQSPGAALEKMNQVLAWIRGVFIWVSRCDSGWVVDWVAAYSLIRSVVNLYSWRLSNACLCISLHLPDTFLCSAESSKHSSKHSSAAQWQQRTGGWLLLVSLWLLNTKS